MRPNSDKRIQSCDRVMKLMKSFDNRTKLYSALGSTYDDGFHDGIKAAAERLVDLLYKEDES